MKINVSIPELREAISNAQAACGTDLPILGNLLLEAFGDTLLVTATNLNQRVRIEVDCDTSEDGCVCLPSDRLSTIAKAVQGDTLSIEVDDNYRATFKAGTSTYQRVGLPGSDFPEPISFEVAGSFEFSQSELAYALSRVAFAQLDDNTSEVLCGVLMESDKDAFRLVATNRRSMGIVTGPPLGDPCKIVLPREYVALLLRSLTDKGDATVLVGGNWIETTCGQTRLQSKLLDGVYPNYKQAIPSTERYTGHAVLDREGARRELSSVHAAGYDKDKPSVVATFKDGSMTLRSTTDASEGQVTLPADVEGSLEVAFNPNFAARALAGLQEKTVRLDWVDAFSGLTFSVGDFRAIVMPIRLQPV